MTKQRNDSHSTEFGLWLRQQPQIASSLGYAATNIDYMWCNFRQNKWMFLEEKRYLAPLSYSQRMLFDRIKNACKDDPTFCGLHFIQFEKTSPEDGKIFWNGAEMDKSELFTMLTFGGE
jgi:hypothetical protein